MKKITLFLFLIASVLSYAQAPPYTYENGTTTATFEFGGLNYSNIANPDVNADNPSSRVLEVNKPAGAEWFGGFGYGSPSGPIIADMANGTAFTVKVWSNKSSLPIRFELQRPGEVSYNVIQLVANANTWTELTFDFTSQVNGSEEYSVIVLQPDYDVSCEGATPACPPIQNAGVFYFDDIIQVGAPAPTCSDGIQNGDETGVDCGGTCEPCAASVAEPTVSAAQASSTGNDLYVYSDVDSQSFVTNFNFNAFQGGGTISQVDIENNGNSSGKIENLTFYGAQWDAVDLVAGGYQFVHLSYYATTSTEFNFYLIDQTAGINGGSPEEPRYRFGGATPDQELVAGAWQSVFIPLQHFLDDTPNANYDLNDIFQWKFDGNGTIYFDNIFFSTTNTLGSSSAKLNVFNVSPNPTGNTWNINSANTIINTVKVYDLAGKLVMDRVIGKTSATLDATNLSSGLYIAKISSNDGTQNIKLIKE